MYSIDEDEASKLGVSTKHERMENGERRFRLIHADGTAYVRTEAPSTSPTWQKAHFHNHVMETYLVESGSMVLVEMNGEQLKWHEFRAGEIVTTRPGVAHNVILSACSVIHTVKHGTALGGADWHEVPDLTKTLTPVSFDEAIKRCGRS